MNNNNKKSKYVFFGYEVLHSRIGLELTTKDVTSKDDERAIKEITQMYKDRYGYNDIIIKKDINDPTMVLVYVKVYTDDDKPYLSNIIY